MPDFRVYIAVSLDGYIATPDGGVAWLDAYDSDAFDFAGFMKQIGAIVMGRRTFDQVLGWGEWPYASQRVIIQTHRPLPPDCPPGVEAYSGPVEPLADRLRTETRGDVWLVGGGESIQSFLLAGLVDRWQIFVMPVLLHAGVHMFPSSAAPATTLRLVQSRSYSNGVVEQEYQGIGE